MPAPSIEAEDSDRHVSLAVGVVAIVDGPMPNAGLEEFAGRKEL